MSKVWAYSGIQSAFLKNTLWEVVIPFTGLADLVDKLREKESPNQVDVLAIVAHGDKAGQVQLTPPLTNVDAARADLVRLRGFIKHGGRLMFLACQAATGVAGDTFLMKISRIIAGCEVVGFVVANQVYAPQAGTVKVFSVNSSRNDEWSEEAKWAVNGSIVRPPAFEVLLYQERDPSGKNHCGSDKCPGHGGRGHKHRCDPYQRSSWPPWIVSK
jgi:hypothetical protein